MDCCWLVAGWLLDGGFVLTVRERARFEKQATWMLDLSPAVALEAQATVVFQLSRKVTEWE